MFSKGANQSEARSDSHLNEREHAAKPEQKVDVSIEHEGDEERVALRYSTWTEGLGWCCQKTIKLDAEHLDDLQRALTLARHRINRRRAESGQTVQAAQVIQFPALS